MAGRNALNRPKESLSRGSTTQADEAWNQIGCEEKKAAVHEEISRIDKLPENSSRANANRHLRILNKISSLISFQTAMVVPLACRVVQYWHPLLLNAVCKNQILLSSGPIYGREETKTTIFSFFFLIVDRYILAKHLVTQSYLHVIYF